MSDINVNIIEESINNSILDQSIAVNVAEENLNVAVEEQTITVNVVEEVIELVVQNEQSWLPYTRWIDYVAWYNSLLYLETIAEWDVYKYDYLKNTTLYRCIGVEDIFYSSFAWWVLSGEVIRKKITL